MDYFLKKPHKNDINKIHLNLKLEIALLVIGGVLRILGAGINIWYFLSQKFSSDILYYLSGSFLVAPSLIFFVITVVYFMLDCCRCKVKLSLFKLAFGLMITIGGPLGVPLFLYAGLLACNESHTGDFYILEGISRATSLIESLFESMPQVCIQIYNNNTLASWHIMNIISVTVSLLSILYTGYKLCYAVDKIKHFENASAVEATAKSIITNKSFNNNESKTMTDRKIDAELEVYDVDNI